MILGSCLPKSSFSKLFVAAEKFIAPLSHELINERVHFMKRATCIVIVCMPICYFALLGFSVFWNEHNGIAAKPQVAEEQLVAEEVTTLLPMISGEWVRQADMQIMELAHGWIVRRSPANGGGLTFVPKPKSE
jgi:hypothetical protein